MFLYRSFDFFKQTGEISNTPRVNVSIESNDFHCMEQSSFEGLGQKCYSGGKQVLCFFLGEIICTEILAPKLPYVIFLDQLNPLVFT